MTNCYNKLLSDKVYTKDWGKSKNTENLLYKCPKGLILT